MDRELTTQAHLEETELTTQAHLEERFLTTQADIGNTVYGTEVHSVNGKVGHVVLDANDVGALPSDTPIPTVPTDVSAFNNDAGYLSDTLYPVVITQVSVDDDTNYTADKTFEEVRNAYDAGMIPVIVWKGAFIFANAVTDTTINFSRTVSSSYYQFNYRSDRDVIVRSKVSLAKTSDIPSDVSQLTNDAGYLSDAYFIVGIEMDVGNHYYADCTFAEALTEYKSGKILIAKFGDAVFRFSGINSAETSMSFSTIFTSGKWVQHLTFKDTEAITSMMYKIPSKTSELVNDSGFLTQHQDLSAYALKSEIPAEKFLFVNITQNSGAYISDHTFAEIKQAITDGLIPILVDYKTTYTVGWHSDTAVMFDAVYGYRVWEYRIYSDGRVIQFETQLARQSDVYTKTEIDSMIGDIETLLQGI